ncbi:unnamed protein product [Paramecium primaurelia]|uniref:Uncharacterized protein n=1 Tax=Paramecium primaurelia TaxID=5886 RepID=A0A8S1K2Z0_PARPR|nr:unnamed protein product [Paramecium primaurelia]
MYQPQFQVQQSQFESPPVLYSQSQPMMISNQNNMSYQMVNLGAGAIMQRLKQRQEEEMLVDLLAKQNELIASLTEDFNWRLDKRKQQMEEELEELEKKTVIARQKKAEQDYLYKLNRQLNFGLQRIKEQEIKKLVFPKAIQLGMKVPSIQNHEALEQVYPNLRLQKKEQLDEEVQANVDLEFSNPYRQFVNPNFPQYATPMMPFSPPQPPQQYQPQFNQQQSYQDFGTSPQIKRSSQISKKISQGSQRSSQKSLGSHVSKQSLQN